MDAKQLHDYIIVPVLDHLGMDSLSARLLILGTALIESDLASIRQRGGGPAMGLWQMEPNTHDDIWENYLAYREALANSIRAHMIGQHPSASAMKVNFYYGTAMARIHYWRVAAPLPDKGDSEAQAWYWKRWYNTFQPGETKKYQLKQVARFVGRFPKALL